MYIPRYILYLLLKVYNCNLIFQPLRHYFVNTHTHIYAPSPYLYGPLEGVQVHLHPRCVRVRSGAGGGEVAVKARYGVVAVTPLGAGEGVHVMVDYV